MTAASPTQEALREKPHQHGFVMAGEKTLFLCHMPMHLPTPHCHHVHLYEMVIRASIPEDTWARYRKAYAAAANGDPAKGDTVFLVNHEDDTFTLPDLVLGRKVSFEAVVYPKARVQPGNRVPPWDKSMKPLLDRTTVTVERVVHWRHFDSNFDPPASLTYILFGEGDEAFLQNYHTRPPDVDHVVQLRKKPDWLPDDLLELSVQVSFPELKSDGPVRTCGSPLRPGSIHPVEYYGMTTFDGTTPLPRFEVEVDRTLWLNTSILNTTGADPCASGLRL